MKCFHAHWLIVIRVHNVLFGSVLYTKLPCDMFGLHAEFSVSYPQQVLVFLFYLLKEERNHDHHYVYE